jgi:hypothetical protein
MNLILDLSHQEQVSMRSLIWTYKLFSSRDFLHLRYIDSYLGNSLPLELSLPYQHYRTNIFNSLARSCIERVLIKTNFYSCVHVLPETILQQQMGTHGCPLNYKVLWEFYNGKHCVECSILIICCVYCLIFN